MLQVKKITTTLTLLMILLLVLAACSQPSNSEQKSTDSEKHLTFIFNFASQTIDPSLDYTPLRAGIAETLVKLDEDLTIQPWIAQDWKSEDGQTWIFTIREGMTFHNGKEVDAEAVKLSIARAIELNPGVKQVLRIQSMEANGQTLKIVTEKPFPQFPSELVHPNTAIIDVSEPDIDRKPVGTGPFEAASFTPGSTLQLSRYDGYWNGAAKLESATFAFNEDANARLSSLKSGYADIVYRPPVESMETMEQDKHLQLDSVVGLKTHELIFNMNHTDLKNDKVRKAFDALVDREALQTDIMGGQATIADGPFLPSFPFVPAYDEKSTGLDTARKLFKEAGYKVVDGKIFNNGKPLAFKLVTYSSRPEFPLFAQVLQAQAKELGITITIELVENYEDYLMNDVSWDLGTYSPLIAPRGDASYFLNVSFKPDGALNYGRVNDRELNALIEKLDETVDTAERNELIGQALTRIDQQTYYSYLVHPNILVAYKNNVLNWVTSKSEYYMLTNQLDVNASK